MIEAFKCCFLDEIFEFNTQDSLDFITQVLTKHLHLQSVIEVRSGVENTGTTKRLKNLIAGEVIPHMVGRKIQCKPLEGTQTVIYMAGQ